MSRFWQFAQLSDAYKNHNLLDRIPVSGTKGELFIGGLKVLDRPHELSRHGITHILSVLEYNHCDSEEFAMYQRLWISAEDHPFQNLLRHLERSNTFIEQALAADGRVLVHCAMGVSRSATLVCSFLMYKHKISFLEALGQLQQFRPLCAPNVGFVEQLEVYERMLNVPSEGHQQLLYAEWLSKHAGGAKL